MRVLATGAAGYVGSAVVRELIARDHNVVAAVRDRMAKFPPSVEVRRGDLLDASFVRELVKEVDGVCHLAALTRIREATGNPARYYRANVGCTIELLDALTSCSAPSRTPFRFVSASTGSVYGTPPRQPIREETPPAPLNPYAATKVACEDLVGWQAATGGLGAVSLRIFNVAGGVPGLGADPDTTRILPKAVAVAAGRADRVQINGDGGAVRDFVHVTDVARAFALALEAAEPGRHTAYNVGATPASVREIIETVEQVTGRPVAVEHRPVHPGEAPDLRADTSKIRARLGWRPECSALTDLVRTQWEESTR